jgi:hypothetical protein
MPFVNVYFKGTTIGTTTDFDGFFKITSNTPTDSIVASYIGYISRAKAVKKGETQNVLFQLKPQATNLEEVVVVAGENGAWPILRKVIENKEKNDLRNLDYYEYESYRKSEVAIDNITEKFRKKKTFKKIVQLFDSIKTIAGEDGKPVLPVFMSESISNFYFRKSPEAKTEKIIANKITGVGLEDGSFVTQLLASSFQEYNFYKNWLLIVDKEFASPIQDGWKLNYNYYLADTAAFVNGTPCYKIEYEPKRLQDLAFSGTIWITKDDYALKQIDATVGKRANLNFIEKIRIQQELEKTETGAWISVKNRILVDIDELSGNTPGIIAKFYVSNKNIKVNNELPEKSYDLRVEYDESKKIDKQEYWIANRHDSLSTTEQNVYKMIDSIRNIPMVKNYIEVANIITNGYKKIGPIDFGPYIYLYNYNDLEGHRFRLGFRTNYDFHKKITIQAYLARSTNQDFWKYNGRFNYLFNKNKWTEFGIERHNDIMQVGLIDNLEETNSLFLYFAFTGTLRRPFLQTRNNMFFSRQIKKDWQQKISFTHESFSPYYRFLFFEERNFATNVFNTFEITTETRWAKNENYVFNDNKRISLGTYNPVFNLKISQGIKGVFNSGFNYTKFKFSVNQIINLGNFGYAKYYFTAGKIFGTLPYPLLKIHLGNETFFYNVRAFNLMNYFEFISDTYASLKYDHYLEGLLTNRIPLIKRLKWRVLMGTNTIYGYNNPKNVALIPEFDTDGSRIPRFNTLRDKPYIEINYGVENIFKILRVDFIHRLTYFNAPNANKFGVKASLQFKL